MIEQILMGASAVITLSACYCGWHYANKAQYLRELLADARSDRRHFKEGLEYWADEAERMAEVIGKHQSKAHACDKCNQFASKRKAKTAELAAYVAGQKAA